MKAAKEAGVSYGTVLKWMKEAPASAKSSIKSAAKDVEKISVDTVAALDKEVETKEAEIEKITVELNEKKSALKELKKAKEKAEKVLEKEAEIKKAAQEKEQLLDALKNSNKSFDEILAFLK